MRFRAELATAPSRAPWIATSTLPAPAIFLRRPAIRASRRPIGTPRVRDRQSRRLLSVRSRATVASGRKFDSSANRGEGLGSPGIRRSPDVRTNDDGRRIDQPSTTRPPAGTRAIPRGTPDNSPERSTNSGWSAYDRSGGRSAPQSIPDSRRDSPETGYRRSPEGAGNSDGGGAVDRYRAVPRQDAPRPSYDAPRASPRSYGAPSQESRPPSSGGAPERRGAPSGGPSADRPSRGESPSNSGGSRSRGSQPSQGQATSRGRG